uniref:EF-hand domain-containing protein n=1 Tax=Helicotheca tamesis TaxID=374047 RepID=A0A7S2MRB8_9STRA|mmetsp:Transcript_20350/g.27876  ORF Transcript_20350/g.27876 Transcript_20350/m.27876 type:complete len:174 (+) Transcript_20350:146-667(+)|eukprot:CAMPEP_0185737222 /NCGR_PEP_ID=MMETSP1171-20130828/29959_1 /TAXON_ID=374046 /ORGANISM="Helicotheca tamensis, Strain CCMP826" /LENGTH=173 /DNA_ID=CAMNT_0028408095 /DNA_START=136 /DNA_END=657 /DNA_ORIENTATION=-
MKFRPSSKKKKDPKKATAPAPKQASTKRNTSLIESDVAAAREAFDMYDIDGDGHITLTELSSMLKSLGKHPTDSELINMIRVADKNGDNEIDFDEFLICLEMHESSPQQELRDAFDKIDVDGNGCISASELHTLMKSLHQNLTKAEIDEIMKEVDTDGNGEIDFEEFCAMMAS